MKENYVPYILIDKAINHKEYLGFADSYEDALDLFDSSSMDEDTEVKELDKQTYLELRDEHLFNYNEQKELNSFFGISEEPNIDKYESRYFLEDKPGHSKYRGWFNSAEEAVERAKKDNMVWWRVVGYNYETSKWDTLAQSEELVKEDLDERNKAFDYKGIHVVYDEGEEQDLKDLIDEMVENYYEVLKDVKEMNFAFSDEDGNFIIDDELYQYAGGRLYGPYGRVKFIDGKWWKEIKD